MRIQLNQVCKNYEKKDIFHICDYEFKPNMIHGVIGDNGSGKTTLLRMIAGLDKCYDGEILYNHKLYHEELIKEVTYISQKPYMIKRSVFENIAYPLKIRGYSKDMIHNKVDLYLKKFGIEYIKNREAEVLSAGERQKVALARGLIFEPKLLLLDEATANVDPDTVEFLENLLIEYQRMSKVSIILVSHNINQVIRVCDNVSLLKDGTLVRCNQDYLLKCMKEMVIAIDYKRFGV